MEELLNELNKLHGEKLKLMEECGVNTFADKGDFYIKARSLYKANYLNGYKAGTVVSTFTKETIGQVIGKQIELTKNAISHYAQKHSESTMKLS